MTTLAAYFAVLTVIWLAIWLTQSEEDAATGARDPLLVVFAVLAVLPAAVLVAGGIGG